MTKNWLQVDIISLLGIDRTMTPDEIDDLTGVLEKEVWYRVLEEELPKKISQSDYTYLKNNLAGKTDFNDLIAYIKETLPSINIEETIENVTIAVKKEFAEAYKQQLTTPVSSEE